MEHTIKQRGGRTSITIRAGKGEDVRDSPLASALGLPRTREAAAESVDAPLKLLSPTPRKLPQGVSIKPSGTIMISEGGPIKFTGHAGYVARAELAGVTRYIAQDTDKRPIKDETGKLVPSFDDIEECALAVLKWQHFWPLPDPDHVEIGTVLYRNDDRHNIPYSVTAETRASWIVRQQFGDGGLGHREDKIAKDTMQLRGVSSRTITFVTAARRALDVEAHQLRRAISKRVEMWSQPIEVTALRKAAEVLGIDMTAENKNRG